MSSCGGCHCRAESCPSESRVCGACISGFEVVHADARTSAMQNNPASTLFPPVNVSGEHCFPSTEISQANRQIWRVRKTGTTPEWVLFGFMFANTSMHEWVNEFECPPCVIFALFLPCLCICDPTNTVLSIIIGPTQQQSASVPIFTIIPPT